MTQINADPHKETICMYLRDLRENLDFRPSDISMGGLTYPFGVSSIQHPASSIEYRVSSIEHLDAPAPLLLTS
jgi:hypothetical protein